MLTVASIKSSDSFAFLAKNSALRKNAEETIHLLNRFFLSNRISHHQQIEIIILEH
jgi:hypothetical protein